MAHPKKHPSTQYPAKRKKVNFVKFSSGQGQSAHEMFSQPEKVMVDLVGHQHSVECLEPNYESEECRENAPEGTVILELRVMMSKDMDGQRAVVTYVGLCKCHIPRLAAAYSSAMKAMIEAGEDVQAHCNRYNALMNLPPDSSKH